MLIGSSKLKFSDYNLTHILILKKTQSRSKEIDEVILDKQQC